MNFEWKTTHGASPHIHTCRHTNVNRHDVTCYWFSCLSCRCNLSSANVCRVGNLLRQYVCSAYNSFDITNTIAMHSHTFTAHIMNYQKFHWNEGPHENNAYAQYEPLSLNGKPTEGVKSISSLTVYPFGLEKLSKHNAFNGDGWL